MLIGLLATDCFDFDGRFCRAQAARNEPKGPQRPHPPICIGGKRGEAHAAHHRPLRPALELLRAGRPPSSPASATLLAAHCADIGRDPKEIVLSAHVWLKTGPNYRAVIEDAIALGAEGLDLAIVHRPHRTTRWVLEPLAEAIRDSGCGGQRTDPDNGQVTTGSSVASEGAEKCC